jgi:hypothetical protein
MPRRTQRGEPDPYTPGAGVYLHDGDARLRAITL